jgi:hypothetical protein
MNLRGFCRAVAGALVLAAAVFVAPACASPRGRMYVRVGPPAPIGHWR